MAATGLTGASGAITINADDGPSTINVYRWNARVVRDVFDDSNFGSALNARTKIGGMMQIIGTFEGTCDSTATPSIGTLATVNDSTTANDLVLTMDTTFTDDDLKIEFQALLQDITVNTVKVDRITVSGTFVSAEQIAAANFVTGTNV